MNIEQHEIINFNSRIPLKVFVNKIGHVQNHWHKSIELTMVLEGTLEVKLDSKKYYLNPDDIILFNSNEMHELYSENAVLYTVQISMERHSQIIEPLQNVVFDCNTTTDKNESDFEGLRFAFARLLMENSEISDSVDYKNYSLSYFIVSELLEHFRVDPKENTLLNSNNTKQNERIKRLINYIDDHYAENISLQDVADSEGISTAYLSSFFNKYLGVNFSKYYTEVKLEHALEDLLNSKDSIDIIARRNGFSEQHAFYRAFKSYYKMLPSEYRKQQNNHEDKKKTNINYQLIEPTSYLRHFEKYLHRENEEISNTAKENIKVSVDNIAVNEKGTKLKHTFKKYTAVGQARHLLDADIQKMLIDWQKEIGFEYIKFHGILSDDMKLVTRDKEGKLNFSYTLVDRALDFLLQINLKPLIQFSFMPECMAKIPEKKNFSGAINTSPPKDIKEWDELIENFTHHIINRYGMEEVSKWMFCAWNEPMTSEALFGFKDDEDFFDLYKHTYFIVKNINKNFMFGSTSIIQLESDPDISWIEKYISFMQDNECVPDFINVHYYSDIFAEHATRDATSLGIFGKTGFPKDKDAFGKWIGRVKELYAKKGLKKLPIYMTEWNFTFSHANLLNDTCFKSCYILRNLLINYDRLDSFGYWSLTDLIEEDAIPEKMFHGGMGIYTINGIRKNVFWSFYFANKLGSDLIAADEGYFITKSDNAYQIITYNYVHYGNFFAAGDSFNLTETNRYTPFNMTQNMEMNINLMGMDNGKYKLKEYFINRNNGSLFDEWLKMGAVDLDSEELKFLEGASVPGMHKELLLIEKNSLKYKAVLEPLEIRCAIIQKID